MLVSIALLPLAVPQWWDSNRNKTIVSVALSLPVLAVVLASEPRLMLHSLLDYLSFLTLLGSLFVISGGIYVKGEFAGTPLVNAMFLGLGALLANLIGTTGASMLMIRPFLRANQLRRHRAHLIVFFIFIVSNTAGLLTPLGDPPLFLGFLRGVPFTWTFRLLPQWLFATAVLLAVYFVWDTVLHAKEPPERIALDKTKIKPLRVAGKENLVLLGGVVAATAF